MSELQIGLVIVGLLAVAAVYAFNRRQENKYRQRAERAFNQRHADILLEPRDEAGGRGDPGFPPDVAERIEPQFNAAPDYRQRIKSIDTADASTATERDFRTSDDDSGVHAPSPGASGASTRVSPLEPSSEPTREPATPHASPAPAAFSAQTPVRKAEKHAMRESAIDYVAKVEALDSLSAAQVANLRSKLATTGKPVRCSAYNARAAVWEDEPADGVGPGYTQIRCAIQLADRKGAISEPQLRAFREAITEFASQNRASFDCPPVQPALTAARKLDQFCMDADIAIGLNVISEQKPFSGTKIRALAEAGGMKLEHDGAFHLFNEHGATLFTLANREAAPFYPDQIKTITTQGLTLLLDVPRVADGSRVFNQMIQFGRALAATLGGKLVDDNRRILNDAEFEAIRHQITVVRAAMDAQKISAGGRDALRLFS